jgi:hypothetical protein
MEAELTVALPNASYVARHTTAPLWFKTIMHKMFTDIGLQLFFTKFTTAEFRLNRRLTFQ